ncbi:MAG TPA: hypothetical protein VGB70_15125 [Allosphingosinicella sp.]
MPPAALSLALLAASCGSNEPSNTPIGDPTAAELANRIEAIAQVPEEEREAAPRRLELLREDQVPADLRTGRLCRLTEGSNLLLVAGDAGAAANIDGKPVRLRIAGPVGPIGGYFEGPGATVSIGLKPPEGATVGSVATLAGITVGGDSAKPIQRHQGSWTCRS